MRSVSPPLRLATAAAAACQAPGTPLPWLFGPLRWQSAMAGASAEEGPIQVGADTLFDR